MRTDERIQPFPSEKEGVGALLSKLLLPLLCEVAGAAATGCKGLWAPPAQPAIAGSQGKEGQHACHRCTGERGEMSKQCGAVQQPSRIACLHKCACEVKRHILRPPTCTAHDTAGNCSDGCTR